MTEAERIESSLLMGLISALLRACRVPLGGSVGRNECSVDKEYSLVKGNTRERETSLWPGERSCSYNDTAMLILSFLHFFPNDTLTAQHSTPRPFALLCHPRLAMLCCYSPFYSFGFFFFVFRMQAQAASVADPDPEKEQDKKEPQLLFSSLKSSSSFSSPLSSGITFGAECKLRFIRRPLSSSQPYSFQTSARNRDINSI